jgi:hypothetical protein
LALAALCSSFTLVPAVPSGRGPAVHELLLGAKDELAALQRRLAAVEAAMDGAAVVQRRLEDSGEEEAGGECVTSSSASVLAMQAAYTVSSQHDALVAALGSKAESFESESAVAALVAAECTATLTEPATRCLLPSDGLVATGCTVRSGTGECSPVPHTCETDPGACPLTTALGLKVDQAAMDTLTATVETKAVASEVTESLQLKADETTVTALDAAVASLADEVAAKVAQADASGYELMGVAGQAADSTDAVKIRATGFYLFDGSTSAASMPADSDASLVLKITDADGVVMTDDAVSVTGTTMLSLSGGATTVRSTSGALTLESVSTGDIVLQTGTTEQVSITPTTITLKPENTAVITATKDAVTVAKATTFSEAVTVSTVSDVSTLTGVAGSSGSGGAVTMTSGAGDGDGNSGGTLTLGSGAGGGGAGVAGDIVLKAGSTAQMTMTPTQLTVSPAGTTVLTVDATSVTVAKATTFSEAVTVQDSNAYETLKQTGGDTDAVTSIRATGFYLFDGSTSAASMPADSDASLVLKITDAGGVVMTDDAVSVTGTTTLALSGGATTVRSTSGALTLESASSAGMVGQYGTGLTLQDSSSFEVLTLSGGGSSSAANLRANTINFFRDDGADTNTMLTVRAYSQSQTNHG